MIVKNNEQMIEMLKGEEGHPIDVEKHIGRCEKLKKINDRQIFR